MVGAGRLEDVIWIERRRSVLGSWHAGWRSERTGVIETAVQSDVEDSILTSDGVQRHQPASDGSGAGQQDPSAAARNGRRRWWAFLGGLFLLGVIIGVAGSRIEIDYYGLRPGGVRETERLLEVEGIDAYPSDGEILYTTVNIGRLNIWEWVRAEFLDDDTDVWGADAVLGDRSRDEKREEDLQLMQSSKSTATLVALMYLGYDAFEGNGTMVLEVVEDGPSEGLLERGDVILEANGAPTLQATELREVISGSEVGDTLGLDVERNGEVVEVSVTLAEHPDNDGPFLGVSPDTRLTETDLPFSIDVESGDVGGPSAGLAFSLAMVDALTEGDLTGGTEVAVTGTLGLDGCVGPIGGLKQKTIAVGQTDAVMFLVPAVQVDEAVENAPDHLEIVPVAGFDDAIAALAEGGGDTEHLPDDPLELDCG